jgi:flagellar basal body rod protein FlgC
MVEMALSALEHALSTVSKNIACRNNLSTVSKKESSFARMTIYYTDRVPE